MANWMAYAIPQALATYEEMRGRRRQEALDAQRLQMAEESQQSQLETNALQRLAAQQAMAEQQRQIQRAHAVVPDPYFRPEVGQDFQGPGPGVVREDLPEARDAYGARRQSSMDQEGSRHWEQKFGLQQKELGLREAALAQRGAAGGGDGDALKRLQLWMNYQKGKRGGSGSLGGVDPLTKFAAGLSARSPMGYDTKNTQQIQKDLLALSPESVQQGPTMEERMMAEVLLGPEMAAQMYPPAPPPPEVFDLQGPEAPPAEPAPKALPGENVLEIFSNLSSSVGRNQPTTLGGMLLLNLLKKKAQRSKGNLPPLAGETARQDSLWSQ